MRIQFEADTFSDILEEIKAFVAILKGMTEVRAGELSAQAAEAAPVAFDAHDETPAPKKIKKAAKGATITKAAAKPAPEPADEDEDETEAEDAPEDMRAAVDLEKLKNEQLDRLRDLFNAGKGPFVRKLLSQHGGGAKVFPEVDAKRFPAIKVAIDRELN